MILQSVGAVLAGSHSLVVWDLSFCILQPPEFHKAACAFLRIFLVPLHIVNYDADTPRSVISQTSLDFVDGIDWLGGLGFGFHAIRMHGIVVKPTAPGASIRRLAWGIVSLWAKCPGRGLWVGHLSCTPNHRRRSDDTLHTADQRRVPAGLAWRLRVRRNSLAKAFSPRQPAMDRRWFGICQSFVAASGTSAAARRRKSATCCTDCMWKGCADIWSAASSKISAARLMPKRPNSPGTTTVRLVV